MIERFWNWVDSRAVVRRAVLFSTVWLTWQSFVWAGMYAESSKLPGLELAAVIAAVTAPVSALQGYVFSVYAKGRT